MIFAIYYMHYINMCIFTNTDRCSKGRHCNVRWKDMPAALQSFPCTDVESSSNVELDGGGESPFDEFI